MESKSANTESTESKGIKKSSKMKKKFALPAGGKNTSKRKVKPTSNVIKGVIRDTKKKLKTGRKKKKQKPPRESIFLPPQRILTPHTRKIFDSRNKMKVFQSTPYNGQKGFEGFLSPQRKTQVHRNLDDEFSNIQKNKIKKEGNNFNEPIKLGKIDDNEDEIKLELESDFDLNQSETKNEENKIFMMNNENFKPKFEINDYMRNIENLYKKNYEYNLVKETLMNLKSCVDKNKKKKQIIGEEFEILKIIQEKCPFVFK